jgi:hypothetical protein
MYSDGRDVDAIDKDASAGRIHLEKTLDGSRCRSRKSYEA